MNDYKTLPSFNQTKKLDLGGDMTAAPPSIDATQPQPAKPPAPPKQPGLKGMPSILDSEQIEPPYSTKKVQGVPDNFNDMHSQWMQNRTPEMNTQILEAIQPVIDTAVQSYVGPNANQTARTQAKLMALRALETYDPAKGNVRTHLLSQMQSLRRYAAQQQNIIDIPEQVGLDYQSLSEAENALRDKLGRGPTDDELADETGLSKRRIQKIRSFNQPVSEGMTHNETEEGGSDGTVSSTIPGADPGLDAWLDFVYDDLSSADKLIMDMTLGRNGRKQASVQEIARELNISPSAVSQRAAKIQEMIDKRHQYDVL